ncbi:MAG: competence protein ComK [Bacillota bacterium]|nr:competence protein ComK [Bacillota bacterium]
MEVRSHYIFNKRTVLLTGEYDDDGLRCTRVIEGHQTFLVKLSPVDLINENLLRLGSNFSGAVASSKFILGIKVMCPLQINDAQDMWIFPTKSYKKTDCVWFFLNQIVNTRPLGVRETVVNLEFGHTYTIEMKESSFNNKRRKAEDLRGIMTKNAKGPLNDDLEPKVRFEISRVKGKRKCRIKQMKEEK